MSRRPFLLALDLLVGLSAVAGGVTLVTDPSGRTMRLPLAHLAHSPFRTYLVPGLVLALVVGGSALIAAAAHVRRAASASRLSAVAGAVLVGWILAEVVQVRAYHPLQPILLLVGAAQLALGLRAPLRDDVTAKAMEFLSARRALFVGLSSKPGEFSRMVADAMTAHGIEVVPVNAHAHDPKVYARVADVPSAPAVALLMVPPSQAESVVRECIAAGVRAVWFHRGVGAGSASPEAVALAEKARLTVITDACPLMFLEPSNWLHASHRWGRGHAAPLVTLGRAPSHAHA
jgi:predicted CoA-binding protein